jgi:hypothetical protein
VWEDPLLPLPTRKDAARLGHTYTALTLGAWTSVRRARG